MHNLKHFLEKDGSRSVNLSLLYVIEIFILNVKKYNRYTYIYTYTHIQALITVHTYVHRITHTQARIYIHKSVHMCVCVIVYIHSYVHIHTYTHVYTYKYAHIYTYTMHTSQIYIYTYVIQYKTQYACQQNIYVHSYRNQLQLSGYDNKLEQYNINSYKENIYTFEIYFPHTFMIYLHSLHSYISSYSELFIYLFCHIKLFSLQLNKYFSVPFYS